MSSKEQHHELDCMIKDIIDDAAKLFPDISFREALEYYQPGELALALDTVFCLLKSQQRRVPIDLYEKITNAHERIWRDKFDISQYDVIKPANR
jgi:hypothetical protein